MKERDIYYNAAIREGISEEMEKDSNVFVMGEDVAIYGGVFKVTQGLLEQFGPERVRDTSISEAAIVGAGIGAAIQGMRPVVEIMYVDFIPIAMDQIVNQACELFFVSGGQICVPIVIRTQGGVNAGAGSSSSHSKSLDSWFTHVPGIKIVAPSTPYDAKGLIKSAIRDNNPVIFYENKRLYATTGWVPEEEYIVEIGKADIKKTGKDVTVVSWSRMVLEALEAARKLADEGIEIEIIDLRTLVPLEEEMIFESVRKTGRVLIVHEDWKRTGYGAEIAARIQENLFDYLDAPVLRLAGLDTIIPFSPSLNRLVVPNANDIVSSVKDLLGT